MLIQIPVPNDFSFRETLSAHGWRRLLPFVWHEDAQTLERTEELADGRVVRLTIRSDDAHVFVDVEGDGDEADIRARIRRMLQTDVPLADFYAFCAARPNLAHIPDVRQGRMLRGSTLWEDAVKDVCNVC